MVGYPALEDLFVYNGSGVMPGRTWAVSPDAASLVQRWKRLQSETKFERKQKLFHPQLRHGELASRHLTKIVTKPLGSRPTRTISVGADKGELEQQVRYAFRSFDRQWLVADSRLLNDPRPELWKAYGPAQIFATALRATAPSGGPAITFTSHIPDQDHYKGSFGGRVFPLWADAAAAQPNVSPQLLAELAAAYGREVTAPEVMAYIAAVAAHPGYIVSFREHLRQPGLRIPLTADRDVFAEAVELGCEWSGSTPSASASLKAARPARPAWRMTSPPSPPTAPCPRHWPRCRAISTTTPPPVD